MYETVDQDSPVFDAKGIETVRRDSCPATAKVSMVVSLKKVLFLISFLHWFKYNVYLFILSYYVHLSLLQNVKLN